MTNLASLSLREEVMIDIRRMEEIVDELGEIGATQLISAALEQMALALTSTLEAVRNRNMADAANRADKLSRLAWQVGLVTLAGVAVDVGTCAERGDLPGLCATASRLERIGGQSLTQIWDDDPAG